MSTTHPSELAYAEPEIIAIFGSIRESRRPQCREKKYLEMQANFSFSWPLGRVQVSVALGVGNGRAKRPESLIEDLRVVSWWR